MFEMEWSARLVFVTIVALLMLGMPAQARVHSRWIPYKVSVSDLTRFYWAQGVGFILFILIAPGSLPVGLLLILTPPALYVLVRIIQHSRHGETEAS